MVKETKIAQTEMLNRMQVILYEATTSHEKGFRGNAIKNLKAGLAGLNNTIDKMKAEDVPAELSDMKTKMSTVLEKWSTEVNASISQSKTGNTERAEQTKLKAETLFRDAKAKKVVGEFVAALAVHKGDISVALLVKELTASSSKFKLGEISFADFKTACVKSIEAHQQKHLPLHQKQPHGVFEHIANAVRAMLRALVNVFNYVTGYQSPLFKKADSELGKTSNEFKLSLEKLADCCAAPKEAKVAAPAV
jgi:hypothetical protein